MRALKTAGLVVGTLAAISTAVLLPASLTDTQPVLASYDFHGDTYSYNEAGALIDQDGNIVTPAPCDLVAPDTSHMYFDPCATLDTTRVDYLY